ncbi:MAG: class I SAM-dependent methyltransferase, partial [Roseiarcus sp.]
SNAATLGPAVGPITTVRFSWSSVKVLKRATQFILDRTVVRSVKYIKSRTDDYNENLLDVYKVLWDRAALSSADYIERHLTSILLFHDREPLWDHAITRAKTDGLFMEFGVWSGKSINTFAARLPGKRIYGFDSFEGLKEDYPGTGFSKGSFGLGGIMPKVLPNVTLVKGWFDETVPKFLSQHSESVCFLHLDADTYETTARLLKPLKSRIQSGTVIVFDEYHGFPNWEKGEFRAWQEFCAANNLSYRYLGFSIRQSSVQVL